MSIIFDMGSYQTDPPTGEPQTLKPSGEDMNLELELLQVVTEEVSNNKTRVATGIYTEGVDSFLQRM